MYVSKFKLVVGGLLAAITGKKWALLAKAGRFGMTAVVAVCASLGLGSGVAHAESKGFNLKNQARSEIALQSIDEGNWAEGPAVGDILPERSQWHMELTYVPNPFGAVQLGSEVLFTVGDPGKHWKTQVLMKVLASSEQQVYCNPARFCAITAAVNNNFVPVIGPQ
jgi:hypothetical protein